MIIIIVLFILLFAWPFIEAVFFIRSNLSTPVEISNDRSKDPRYFARSFRKKFNSAWKPRMKSAFLSKSNPVIDVKDLISYEKPINEMVVSLNDFNLNEVQAIFEKEVLIRGKAELRGGLEFRSLAVDDTLILGLGVKIKRWVDAQNGLVVNDHCDLGISATSNERLWVGRNVRFQRLYAPVMELGRSKDEKPVYRQHSKLDEAMRIVPSELRQSSLNDQQTSDDFIHASIIASKHLNVPNHTSINGHLRVYGNLTLGEEVLINGNVFVDGDLNIERYSVLLGNIFVRGNVFIHDQVVLGQPYHPISLVSIQQIRIGLNVVAHGYLHSGKGGIIYPESISKPMLLELRAKESYASFDDRLMKMKPARIVIEDELKHTHPLGLRTMENIDRVVIPEGVTVIRRSFFYQCVNLRELTLPSTLEHIEPFAFYGCIGLEKVNLDQCIRLERIDEFAFTNCSKLKHIQLPSSLKHMGPAVFMGCKQLLTLNFSKASQLNVLPEHLCMDCVELEHVELPLYASMIETSAFSNCTNLLQLELPSYLNFIDPFAFEGIKQISLHINQKNQKDKLRERLIAPNVQLIEGNSLGAL